MARVSLAVLSGLCLAASAADADDPPLNPMDKLVAPLRSFIDVHCVDCHDDANKKGGLDLDTIAFEPGEARNFSTWVKVFERVSAGEMPPQKSPRPKPKEVESCSQSLASELTATERERVAQTVELPVDGSTVTSMRTSSGTCSPLPGWK